LLALGWRGVVGEVQAENDELQQRIADLEQKLRSAAQSEVVE
jgi:BMFP domain-containing protein YqiC